MDNYKIRLMYNKIDYELDQNKIKYSRETVESEEHIFYCIVNIIIKTMLCHYEIV